MFDAKYQFFGKHAKMVTELTAVFDEGANAKLFDRNLDVYIKAPIIGFLYNRKGTKDTSIDLTKDISWEQMHTNIAKFEYAYRLIILLDKENEPDEDARIDKAFRYFGENEDDEVLFDAYVLGGVEVLYEKLIESSRNTSDYVNRLYDFLTEFHERFNSRISNEDIIKIADRD